MPANTSIIPIKAIRDGDQSTGDVVALGEFESGDKLDASYFSLNFTDVSLSGNTTFDTNVLFVDGTNDTLSTGTTSSGGAKLRVFKTSSGGSDSALRVDGSGFTTYFGYGTNADNYIDSGSSGNPAIFRQNGTEVARINSSGDLLIGTTSSAAALRIDADSSTTNNRALHLLITDDVCDQTMYGAYIDYNISGTDATTTNQTHVGLRIDTDSSATGGTTTNDHRIYSIWNDLNISGDSDLAYGIYNGVRSTLSTADTTTSLYGMYNIVQADKTAGTITNAFGQYNLAYAEGTVTNLRATQNLAYLQAGGTASILYGSLNEAQYDSGSTLTSAYGVRSSLDNNGATVTNEYIFYGDYQGTSGGSAYGLYVTGEDQNYFSNSVGIGTDPSYDLHVSGSIYATGDVTAYSDIALKENVETIQNPIDLVNGMRGVTFTRKDTGKEGVGVIAQEMREVLPQVVTEENGHIGVAYGNIVGVLIEAVKELSAKVKQLEETIINKS